MQAHPGSLPNSAGTTTRTWAEGGGVDSRARSSERFDAFVCYGTLIYLLTGTMEGALRYVLIMVHLETALYLRDLFALIVVVWRVHAEINSMHAGRPLLGLIALLGLWSVVGSIYCGSISQVLFGFKIFLPLMLGISAYPSVLSGKWRTGPFILLMWSLATAGLYASAVIRMPWIGLSYQIGDIQVEGNREWTIEGVDRLAGFSRSSIAVGSQILFFSIYVLCFSRSRLVSLVVWAASAPAIILSTSRSALMGFAGASVFLFMQSLLPSLHRFWKCFVPLMASVVILLPLIPPHQFAILETMSRGKTGQVASFFDRIENTWPLAFDLVKSDGNALLGRGVGGIGTPQKTFELEISNPADNLFVYLFVIFGPFSFVILGGILLRLHRAVDISRGPVSLHAVCVAVAVLAVGLTLNCIEDSCVSLFAGMLLSHIFTSSKI